MPRPLLGPAHAPSSFQFLVIAIYLGGASLGLAALALWSAFGAYDEHIVRTRWQVTGSYIAATPAIVDCGFGEQAEEIRYHYTVAGRDYSERYATRCSSKARKRLGGTNFAPGGFNYVYYNPDNPAQSRLSTGTMGSAGGWALSFLFGGLSVASAWLLLRYWRAGRAGSGEKLRGR